MTDLSTPSPRSRRAPRVSGDERERAILATAEALLADRRLQEISVDDLARGAGISRPTFYFYFASKDAVLLALLDRMVAEARDHGAGRPDLVADDPRGYLRAVIGSVYETFRGHRAATLAGADRRDASDEIRGMWARVMEQFVAETTTAIASERARGTAPPGLPARDLATALNLMNERVMHAALAGTAPAVAPDDVVETLVAVWMSAIYGTGAGEARGDE